MRGRDAETEIRRRRRTPQAAQAEIIAAAEALLRERPFRELTVDEVMRRTGLSRPSFYVYFRDRHDLVLRVVDHVREALLAEGNRWLEGEGPDMARAALRGVVDVYAAHGPVLRALADAAADDPGVERAYADLVQGFIDVTAARIGDEMAAGRVNLDVDAAELARALILMNERYLYLSLGGEAQVDREMVRATLTCVWLRTLYGRVD